MQADPDTAASGDTQILNNALYRHDGSSYVKRADFGSADAISIIEATGTPDFQRIKMTFHFSA